MLIVVGLAGCPDGASGDRDGGDGGEECQNACPAGGDTRCDGDLLQVCGEGSDGCLGWQEQRACADEGLSCAAVGGQAQCVCLPSCTGRECGPDGCGRECPPGCPVGEGTVCNAQGQCEPGCQDECEPTGYPACDGISLLTCALQGDGCHDLVSADCPAGEACQGEAGAARCEELLLDLPRPTHLYALPKGSGQVHLGWRMVSSHPELGYNIYRSTTQGGPYTKLNSEPVSDQTNFRDETVSDGTTYFYVVRLVDAAGLESPDSLEARVEAADTDTGEYVRFTGFNPNPGVDDWCDLKFGDVDGDGGFEFLEACVDTEAAIQKFDVAVFARDGTRRWLLEDVSDLVGSALPWTLVDLDGDGRDEVVGLVYSDALNELRAVAYDSLTGSELHRSPALSDNPGQCGGNANVAPAMLDGVSWSVIVQTCNYPSDVRTVLALDSSLQVQWEYTLGVGVPPAGAYSVRGADMDGDGTDEVLFGGTILDSDGQEITHFPFLQVSGFRVGDIRPDLPGLEVFYFNKERDDPEAGLATATTSEPLWIQDEYVTIECSECGVRFPDDVRKGHHGWIGDVDPSPGLESYAAYYWSPLCPNGHWNDTLWIHRLYSSTGEVLRTQGLNDPIDWDGQLPKEIMASPGTGKRMFYVADVIGDYREEFIVMLGIDPAVPPYALLVVTNTSLVNPGTKKPSPWEDRDYLIDKRWTGYR